MHLLRNLALLSAGILFTACNSPELEEGRLQIGEGNTSSIPQVSGAPSAQSATPDLVTTPYCKPTIEVLAGLDAPAVAHLRLRGLVEGMSGQYPGRWTVSDAAQQPVGVTLSPSISGQDGTVELSYANGQVRMIRKTHIPCSPGAECSDMDVTCIDEVEVDMALVVQSTGGELAESLVARLSLVDSNDPDIPSAQFPAQDIAKREFMVQSTVEPAAFQGSMTIQDVSMPQNMQLNRHTLTFSARFNNTAFAGVTLSSMVMTNLGGGPVSHYRFDRTSS